MTGLALLKCIKLNMLIKFQKDQNIKCSSLYLLSNNKWKVIKL